MSENLLKFYEGLLVAKTEPAEYILQDFRKIDVPDNGDCCPMSLITSLLVEGILACNIDTRLKVKNFLLQMYEGEAGIPKDVNDFLDNYNKINSLHQIESFFDSLNLFVKGTVIKNMSDQLRIVTHDYLSKLVRSERDENILINAEEEGDFTPGTFSSYLSFQSYLAFNGISINVIDPRVEYDRVKAALKNDFIKEQFIKAQDEFISLNIFNRSQNHYQTLLYFNALQNMIKELSNVSSVKNVAAATLSPAMSAKTLNKTISVKLPHVSVTEFENANFKDYLLNEYIAEAESGEKYTMQDNGANIDVFLAKEKIATVAEDRKHPDNIKLNIVPGKEQDGAFVALSSFKGFLEANKQDLQKYNAHFTGYDTPEKALGFLESMYAVFNEEDKFDCKLIITFDDASEEVINYLLENINLDEIPDPAEKLKWTALRAHFDLNELAKEVHVFADEEEIEEDRALDNPLEDDDNDSLVTDPDLSYESGSDEGISVNKPEIEPQTKPSNTGGFFSTIKRTLGFGSQQIHVPESDAERDETLNATMDKLEGDAAAEKRKSLLGQIKNPKPQ